MYPAMLSLRDRPVLVVGGGEVALRKVEGLVAQGARVTVVAPRICEGIEKLAFEFRRRPFADADVKGFALVFAATNDRAVNQRVFEQAHGAGLWVNVSDDPELCSFHLPARVQRGAFQIAIASDGGAPFVVRRLRQLLERKFGAEWGEWIDAAARFRHSVRALDLPRDEQERLYDAFFAASVDGERLRARVPSPADILAGQPERRVVPLVPRSRRDAALVSLVGAGPGDPGLLTVKARQRLLAADAVVYDRLAAAALPCDLSERVELHCVGKESGHHSVAQDEICALLVRLALAGKRTVRFKGGDPFVFGRGGEEAEALRSAGVPYEVVPGVTAALGATACAGIPVTQRGESVRLTLITAHECAKDGSQVRWDLLAQDRHATLVGYMGLASLPRVAAKLIAGGMPASTPAALIAQGTTASQRTVVSTLAGLHGAGISAGIEPPAIFVIGPTVRHAASLDWFASRPLAGERIAVFGDGFTELLDANGAAVLELPRPLTPAARVVLEAAPPTGWILQSARDAEAADEFRTSRTFCIDSDTAARARALGFRGVVEVTDVVAAIAAREEEQSCSV